MAKNIFIVVLLLIILVLFFLHYRYTKKVNESKDKIILSLLSELGKRDNGTEVQQLLSNWLNDLKTQS